MPKIIVNAFLTLDVSRGGSQSNSGRQFGLPLQARWLPSRLIPHRHHPRAELQPAHELQVDTLR
jgi:hypothetical protein